MAAAIDLSGATTIEGQILMILESLMNLQDDTTADTGTNRDNEQMVLASTYNDITGVQAVTLSLPVTSTQANDGYVLKADEIFYPKVVDDTSLGI